MRRPFDSLDDFSGKAGQRKRPEPPANRYVEPLGTRQQIEPLAVWEGPLTNKRRLGYASFQRSFAVTGFVVIALIIGGSLFFRVSDVATELRENTSEITPTQQPENSVAAVTTSDPSSLVSTDNPVLTFDEDRPVQRPLRSRPVRTRAPFISFQPRHPLPHPQYIVSDFVPTTLVIYIENGMVKTRIEPRG